MLQFARAMIFICVKHYLDFLEDILIVYHAYRDYE